ncbi:hypothetical protein B566_EDAN018833 [Ephemera danica]|nr:hypothetical protein B566_EDAN018833 [Ephemera danica]
MVQGDSVILPRSLLHRVFEAAARQCGNQPALLSEDPYAVEPLLTFSQLDSAASRLARVIIRHAKSASPSPRDGDFIVAVSLSPGAPLIITLLASWKAGAAYMPVEPGIPPKRAAHILADSTPLFVIAENDAMQEYASVLLYSELEREASELCDEPIADEDVLQPELESTERIATVLYTSGSTGSPKEACTGTTEKLDLGSCPAEMQATAVALLSTVRNVLGAALHTEFISMDANFYEIGGNSLNSIVTITKLQELGFFIDPLM